MLDDACPIRLYYLLLLPLTPPEHKMHRQHIIPRIVLHPYLLQTEPLLSLLVEIDLEIRRVAGPELHLGLLQDQVRFQDLGFGKKLKASYVC